MPVKPSPGVEDYYMDILAHSFEPEGGERVAAGTTTGRVMVIRRDWEGNEAFMEMETRLPNNAPVLGLHWGRREGIFVGSKSLLHLYSPRGDLTEKGPVAKFVCASDVQDVVVGGSNGSTVFGGCDDCKVRAWDVETQKLVMEFAEHKMPVEVCSANSEYVVSGGQDGKIVIYDALLRTDKPVSVLGNGKTTVTTGLDISSDSTWVAAGSMGSPAVFNLKNLAELPKIDVNDPQRIHCAHFDGSNTLWWAGGGGKVLRSQNLTSVDAELQASYGETTIYHVYSITTTAPKKISVAGSSTGILFSDNSDYWEGMVHI